MILLPRLQSIRMVGVCHCASLACYLCAFVFLLPAFCFPSKGPGWPQDWPLLLSCSLSSLVISFCLASTSPWLQILLGRQWLVPFWARDRGSAKTSVNQLSLFQATWDRDQPWLWSHLLWVTWVECIWVGCWSLAGQGICSSQTQLPPLSLCREE